MKFTAIFISFLIVLSGCQHEDPMLSSPAAKAIPANVYNSMEVTADGVKVKADAQFDILFVIDNSASMKAHTENLSRNVNEFVQAFAAVKAIDFHIGFTYVHDAYRYGPIVPSICGPETTEHGVVRWESPGTLKPIIGPVDKMPANGRRYLTRDDDYTTLLRTSLDPTRENSTLIANLVNPDPKRPSICANGPELEESSTPILGALENQSVLEGVNKGFRRKNAFFVAIIVSDAKDEYLTEISGRLPSDPSRPDSQLNRPRLTPADFITRIKQDLGETMEKRRFRIYSVVIAPGTRVGRGAGDCLSDPAFSSTKTKNPDGSDHYIWPTDPSGVGEHDNPLVDIAHMTEDFGVGHQDQVLSICSPNYGAQLALFGKQVQRDAVTDIEIKLPFIPEISKGIKVTIAGEPLENGKDWYYNPQGDGKLVVVHGQNIDWRSPKFANEQIHVEFTPVKDTKNLKQAYPR